MISLLRSLTVLAVVLAAPLAAQADVFLRVLAPGSQTGSSQQAVSLRVTTPTVALRVDARNDGMTGVDLAGASVQLFLDEQPLGPVLAAPYTWTWTVPAGFKGVHIIQAKVTAGGPAGAVYKSFSTMTFGAPNLGAQRLPALPPHTLAGTSLSSRAESPAVTWFQYTGTPPVLPNLPVRGVEAPYPPVNPQALITSSGWIIEPLTNAGHNYAQAVPRLCYEPSGQPWVCMWYQQAGNISAIAEPTVSSDLLVDGPRGTNAVSPYKTCIATPDRPGYGTCINLAGRITSISPTGHVTTLVGPYRTCETCPLQWRGDFQGGLRFKTPNDLSYDIADPRILYVADTYNHRIAKVDLGVTPPKITTLAGSTQGYLDGPGLTAKFNAPFSLVNHGLHPCPGRPEFTDCRHIYVADTMNKAIRILDLFRPGEIPNVITQLGGPTKGTDYDTAYANPTPWVQNCDKATCSVNWPMVVRWDSEYNTIIGETVTGAIRRWNWRAATCNGVASTGCLELITIRPGGKLTAMRGTATNPLPGWLWLEVDRRGEVGPLNDILWSTSITSSGDLYRVSADGTRVGKLDGSGSFNQGQARYVSDLPGHYAWMNAIIWGKLWLSGFGAVGIREARPYTPSDVTTAVNTTVNNRGATIMGTPEIAAVYGRGWNRLGLKTYDELAELGDPDLKVFLRTLIPSLTDAQAMDAMYHIRWNSQRATREAILVGVAMGPGTPGPLPPPTQYTVTITTSGTGQGTLTGAGSYVSGTTATLTATPVAGSQFVTWGGCSALTTPTIILTITANVACVATFNLLPPPPPTVDRFDVVPTTVPVGAAAVLTWATSNATSVTLNGVAVAADGTLTVTPVVTTDYDLVANGITRRVTLTVTKPKPDVRIEIKRGLTYEVIEVTP